MEHFVDGQAHDVPVHGGDAVEVPVLRVLLDQLVGLVPVLQRAANQRIGEEARGCFLGGRGREFDFFAPLGVALFLGERDGALGIPEVRERQFEILRRIQVVLK